MSWTDLLQPASFRDRPFFVQQAEGEVGRAVVVHTYPGKDRAYVEDMGREPRHITLDCLVYGDDYMAARDALIEAFEQPGPGRLVHPYWGEMTVSIVGRARISESADHGGLARISVPFVEAGELVFPTAVAATGAVVEEKAAAAVEVIEADFAERFDVSGSAGFVPAAAADLVRGAAAALEGLTATITSLPESASAFADDLNDLVGAASDLIRTPQTLATRVIDLVRRVRLVAAQPGEALGIVRGMFSFGEDELEVARTTPSRRRQADNQAALVGFQRRAAVVEAVRIAATLEFESNDQAVALRDELLEQLDIVMEESDSDTVYFALVDLRTAMIADLNARGANLAQVRRIVLDETLPAEVLAYNLYGDARRGDEIARRNKVRHPGFLPAGVELEVLTDG